MLCHVRFETLHQGKLVVDVKCVCWCDVKSVSFVPSFIVCNCRSKGWKKLSLLLLLLGQWWIITSSENDRVATLATITNWSSSWSVEMADLKVYKKTCCLIFFADIYLFLLQEEEFLNLKQLVTHLRLFIVVPYSVVNSKFDHVGMTVEMLNFCSHPIRLLEADYRIWLVVGCLKCSAKQSNFLIN